MRMHSLILRYLQTQIKEELSHRRYLSNAHSEILAYFAYVVSGGNDSSIFYAIMNIRADIVLRFTWGYSEKTGCACSYKL